MNDKRYATFFGGAMDIKDSQEYIDSIKIGELLASNGFMVKNGGYRGLMEAVSNGASKYGEAIGITCSLFPSTTGNNFLTQTIVANDLFDRLRLLINDSEIFIAQAGGVGTLAELALTLDLIRKLKNKPTVYIIGDTWKRIFNEIKAIMPKKDYKAITFCENYRIFEDEFLKKYKNDQYPW